MGQGSFVTHHSDPSAVGSQKQPTINALTQHQSQYSMSTSYDTLWLFDGPPGTHLVIYVVGGQLLGHENLNEISSIPGEGKGRKKGIVKLFTNFNQFECRKLESWNAMRERDKF